MRCCRGLWGSFLIGLMSLGPFAMPRAALSDTFTFLNQTGETETVEAALFGSGQGRYALELANGQLRVIPQAAVTERKVAPGPSPITVDGMIALLSEEFGSERVHAMEQDPYIAALVLAAPLPKTKRARVRAYLRTATRFLTNVDKIFTQYAKRMRIPLEDPKFPLVLLIFEQDADFEKYAQQITGGQGLSVGNIAGFYSPLTNWLAVRMSECFSFDVPLHEAIHQQVYNRGLFRRLAPIPAWFNEGIATGFENDGERIAVHPSRINTRYAKQARTARNVSWSDLVQDDSAFRGDVLAGEAYTHAWCLHWMLATGQIDGYRAYVKELSQREPLQELSRQERLKRFEEIFGKSVEELQKDFPRQLQLAAKRQRVNIKNEQKPGYSVTQSGPAEVKLQAVSRLDRGGQLQVRGSIRNRSPFRDWTLYVTVETDSGTYAEWLIPSLASGKTASLKPAVANRVAPGRAGGPSRAYRVHVRSALPGSQEAKAWIDGEVPGPSSSLGF